MGEDEDEEDEEEGEDEDAMTRNEGQANAPTTEELRCRLIWSLDARMGRRLVPFGSATGLLHANFSTR